MKFILAKKIGMTTIYEKGIAKNVTLLDAGKNVISGIRTKERDGYSAAQVSFFEKVGGDVELVDKNKHGKKFKKDKALKVAEFRLNKVGDFQEGKELLVDQFQINEKVNITGVSKGKGFQGVVKRHGFSGSPASHGHRHDLRAPGSIGSAFPERVMRGKKMAGRMGAEQVTMKNIKVALVDKDKGLLAVTGAVPGTVGSVVKVVAKNQENQ